MTEEPRASQMMTVASMFHPPTWSHRLLSRLIAPLGALILSACAHAPMGNEADILLVERAWPYAQIAYNSYHRERGRPDLQPFRLPPRFHLDPVDEHDNDNIGLAYDVLTEEAGPGLFNLIFAFRGTEGSIDLLAHKECDWKFGNHRLSQHERAVGIVKQYLSDPRNLQRGDRRLADIILVGHSLGCGIAIHASYRIPGAWVYAFDSSPRFRRPPDYQTTATDEKWRRLSIAARYEVAKLPRIPAREATQIYLPVRCGRGGPVSRHSMLALATCLTEVAAAEGHGAAAAEAAQSKIQQPDQFSPDRLKRDRSRQVPTCRD
jgi:hypothetical protein